MWSGRWAWVSGLVALVCVVGAFVAWKLDSQVLGIGGFVLALAYSMLASIYTARHSKSK